MQMKEIIDKLNLEDIADYDLYVMPSTEFSKIDDPVFLANVDHEAKKIFFKYESYLNEVSV